MSHIDLFVGVDGGGSKTQVFLMDLRQRIGISCIGKASNPNTVGFEAALETVEQLILRVLSEINADLQDVKGISLCLAGLYRSDHIQQMQEKFSSLFPNSEIEISNDALAALTAGTFGESGVVLIAGTGSICLGESASGQIARAGGLGSLVSDEGSGYDIGRSGLMAAIQSAEFRGVDTSLWQRAKDFYQLKDVSEIVPKLYDSLNPIETVASFARIVIESAPTDEVANQIVIKAIDHYVRLIQSVYIQLDHNLSNNVVLSGSLLTKTDRLAEALRKQLPELTLRVVTTSAAAGAALRAVQYEQKMRSHTHYSHSEIVEAWTHIANEPTFIN